MPSKNTSVISARVKDETAVKLGELAENRGITIAKLIEEMVEEYEKNQESGKGVTPISYAVYDDSFGARIERRLDRLREWGYPEKVIGMMKDNMLNGLDSQIDMLPRRFDARRTRNDDCGC